MKPVRPLILLTLLFAALSVLSWMFPGGISLPGSNFIRIPQLSPATVFQPSPQKKYANISGILNQGNRDSVQHAKKAVTVKDSSLKIEARQVVCGIEFGDSSRSALDAFYKSLEEHRLSGGALHIFHFGDSQLEGDRISGYLRQEFQKEFIGNGPGLFPFNADATRAGVEVALSGNWKGHDLAQEKNHKEHIRAFGPFARCFTFCPPDDGPATESKDACDAWIRFTFSGNGSNHSGNGSRCLLFLKNEQGPLNIEVSTGDQVIRADSVLPVPGYITPEYQIPEGAGSIKLRFRSQGYSEWYAIGINQANTLSVDNFPLRGSAGLNFTEMDPSLLRLMIRKLNVRLIILQFGVNVVPTEADNYSYYETRFFRQLTYLKSLDPDLSVLVISASDASKKDGEGYVSYKSIDKLVDAQRKAAFKAGCAFWDLYSAMGGENSMPSWVFADPSLGSPDFIHFSYTGSRIVGKMLYNALITDFNRYLRPR